MKLYIETDRTRLDAVAVADLLTGLASLGHMLYEIGKGDLHSTADRVRYFYSHLYGWPDTLPREYLTGAYFPNREPGTRTFETDRVLDVFLKSISTAESVELSYLKLGSLEAELEGVIRGIGGILRDLFKNAIRKSGSIASKREISQSDEVREIIEEIVRSASGVKQSDLALIAVVSDSAISRMVDGLRRIGTQDVHIDD